jgi:hypothetical protein
MSQITERAPERKPLQLNSIVADKSVQPRAGLSTDTVTEYVEDMKRGDKFPPPVVFYDGETYWLAEGFHRFVAAQSLNIETIDCTVHLGTKRDAILHACGTNTDHGLRRTNEDKRRVILKLLQDEEWSKWSDREIARRCNVTHDLVGRLRAELAPPDTGDIASMERTFTHPKTGKPPTSASRQSRLLRPKCHRHQLSQPRPHLSLRSRSNWTSSRIRHWPLKSTKMPTISSPDFMRYPTR